MLFGGACPAIEGGAILPNEFIGIAQKFNSGDIVRKLCPQEAFIGSIFKQSPNEIRHAGQQFADRTIFAHAITHLDQRALDRTGHAVKQLKFEAAAIDAELFRHGLRVGDAADVVGAERGGHGRFVLKKNFGEGFEIGVALRFLQKNRNRPAVLASFDFFVIPIRAFDQTHGEARAAFATPPDQVAQIAAGITQIRLNDNSSVRPVAKLGFRERAF